jgi:hypothetical protein
MTEPISEQPEQVPGRAVAWTLGGTVLAIACCVVIVWVLAAFQLTGGGRSSTQDVQRLRLVPPAQPFSTVLPMERSRTAAHQLLDEWTWADRAARRVRMPVGIAIDRYLQGAHR